MNDTRQSDRGGVSAAIGALIGAITALPLLALFYLGEQAAGVPFAPFVVFDWLARILPGSVITLGIDGIVSLITALSLGPTGQTAKTIEQFMALILFVVAGAVVGALAAYLPRRTPLSYIRAGLLSATGVFILILAAAVGLGNPLGSLMVWAAVLLIGWGAIVGIVFERLAAGEAPAEARAGRREILFRLAGGSAAVAVSAWGIGRLLGRGAATAVGDAGQPLATLVAGQSEVLPDLTATAGARDGFGPAPGTRPELTANDDFYRIDINTRPPVVEKDTWVLAVAGLFNRPRDLTLDDLMTYPAVTQPITLSCISNRVGGDLIGTSYWTGARLRDVLADLGLQPAAEELYVEAADGFFESVAMADLMDPRTLLVYGMNGESLPVDHGFPLRIYIPNRYGMKQPKWITRMTAIDHEGDGYWVVRGWSEEARPQIVSVIDDVAIDEPTAEGLIPVGGIAWAGDRGIQKVELQVDDGEWVEAQLRVPPLGPLTWVQWRYDWAAAPGPHQLRVRATDGTGAVQIEAEADVRPDGATGYHSTDVRV